MRNNIPAIRTPERLHIPPTASSTLANGIGLHLIDCGGSEVIRLSLAFRAGTKYQNAPFAASATANMLNEGTERFTSQELAEKLDFLGSYYEVNIDRDYCIVTFCSLSKFLPQTLELMEQMVLAPLFPEGELAVYKAKRKQALTIERQKVSYLARELFSSSLFGPRHPYGISSDASDYDRLTGAQLAQYHKAYYTAGNCFAVASGRIADSDAALIEEFMKKIPVGETVAEPELPAVLQTPSVFREQPGALQTAIRIGRLLFPRGHEDFIGMQVLATALGGYFGSRLVGNLREEKGYTYGVYAAMINLEQSGYLAIATEVGAQYTEAAVAEVFAEMEQMVSRPVAGQELQVVKNMMTGEMMRILDGPFGIADVAIENIQNGRDNSYVETTFEAVNAITPERLAALAEKYLRPEQFVTVAVGSK